MADLLDVPPTRGNLLRLREELKRIRDGHALLDRKREVLAQELFDMIADAEAAQEEARERFRAANDALRETRMHMGIDRLHWISLAPAAEVRAQVRPHGIMGITVPIVTVDVESLPFPYGPGDTSVALDEACERWLRVAQLLGDLAETVITAWRLAMELRKTQRRVNALEEIIIPRHEATVHYIEQTLEEEERETIVHAKKVKALRTPSEEEPDDGAIV